MKFRFTFSPLVLLALVGCAETPTQAAPREAQISVHVRTDSGPLPGVSVVAKRSGRERAVETNEEGDALFEFLPEGSSIELFAECPLGFEGSALKRTIQPARLAPAIGETSRWLLELSCTPLQVVVAVAVLSESCPVKIHLNGSEVGRTSEGVFHHLFKKSRKEELVLSVSPDQQGCVIEEPTFTYAPGERAAFAHIEAKAPPKKRRLQRRVSRRERPARPTRL